MSRKSNRQIIEENECRTRLRKQKRYASGKRINGTPPVRKIHREDWQSIFESLSAGIDFALCKDGISQQDIQFIRRRISLCEKVQVQTDRGRLPIDPQYIRLERRPLFVIRLRPKRPYNAGGVT